MHCDKRIAEKLATGNTEDLSKALTEFEINCQIANEINAKKMVFHLWNGIISDRHIENNLIAYADLIPIAEKHNIDLMIENVVCNHENPMQHWIELAKNYPDIHFIFDTKMAAFHNQIEQIYDKKYDWFWKEKRIEHLHVNDYAGGYMEWENLKTLPLGSGKINFKKFFTFLKEKNYRGDFTVEATAFLADGNVDYNMLNKCFADIKEYLK
jgi:sugar phosphate isomerase/epimerase